MRCEVAILGPISWTIRIIRCGRSISVHFIRSLHSILIFQYHSLCAKGKWIFSISNWEEQDQHTFILSYKIAGPTFSDILKGRNVSSLDMTWQRFFDLCRPHVPGGWWWCGLRATAAATAALQQRNVGVWCSGLQPASSLQSLCCTTTTPTTRQTGHSHCTTYTGTAGHNKYMTNHFSLIYSGSNFQEVRLIIFSRIKYLIKSLTILSENVKFFK